MQAEERYATQKLLTRLATLDMDREIADRAGELIADSKRAGRALSVPDAIITATAINHRLALVTLNPGDFQSIAGLSLFALDELADDGLRCLLPLSRRRGSGRGRLRPVGPGHGLHRSSAFPALMGRRQGVG
jgi:hypothetical protein